MCIQVWTEAGGLGTLVDLRLAGLTITPEDHDSDHDDIGCLCGVDVEAILERSNVPYHLDDIGEPVVDGPLPNERENDG